MLSHPSGMGSKTKTDFVQALLEETKALPHCDIPESSDSEIQEAWNVSTQHQMQDFIREKPREFWLTVKTLRYQRDQFRKSAEWYLEKRNGNEENKAIQQHEVASEQVAEASKTTAGSPQRYHVLHQQTDAKDTEQLSASPPTHSADNVASSTTVCSTFRSEEVANCQQIGLTQASDLHDNDRNSSIPLESTRHHDLAPADFGKKLASYTNGNEILSQI